MLITFAFPEGGTEPFVFSSFQPALLIAVAVFLALPREEKLLRYGVAAYAAALAAAFLIDSPMGGNATRMGSLLLGPALAFGLWRRQRFALVLLAPFLLYWQWSPVVRDLETVHAQPSVKAGLLRAASDFLREASRGRRVTGSRSLPSRAPLGGGLRAQGHLHRPRLGAPARPQAELRSSTRTRTAADA